MPRSNIAVELGPVFNTPNIPGKESNYLMPPDIKNKATISFIFHTLLSQKLGRDGTLGTLSLPFSHRIKFLDKAGMQEVERQLYLNVSSTNNIV